MIQLREFETHRVINLMPNPFNRNEYRDLWGDIWEKADPLGYNNYVRRKRYEPLGYCNYVGRRNEAGS